MRLPGALTCQLVTGLTLAYLLRLQYTASHGPAVRRAGQSRTKLLLDRLKASAPARVAAVSSGAQAMGLIELNDLQAQYRQQDRLRHQHDSQALADQHRPGRHDTGNAQGRIVIAV